MFRLSCRERCDANLELGRNGLQRMDEDLQFENFRIGELGLEGS